MEAWGAISVTDRGATRRRLPRPARKPPPRSDRSHRSRFHEDSSSRSLVGALEICAFFSVSSTRTLRRGFAGGVFVLAVPRRLMVMHARETDVWNAAFAF